MFVRSIPKAWWTAALGVVLLPSMARASCFDGVRNGPESSIDCGGDCPPCERGRWCRAPRDCYSGRCSERICEEQLREDDMPPPRGYVVERAEADGPAVARTVGWVSLGLGYAGAYVAALSLPGELSALYAPVVGPWIEVADDGQSLRVLIAIDALLQSVGAGLVIGGYAMAGEQLVRQDAVVASVRIDPRVSRDGAGLFVLGAF
jgi:hypothetical protein